MARRECDRRPVAGVGHPVRVTCSGPNPYPTPGRRSRRAGAGCLHFGHDPRPEGRHPLAPHDRIRGPAARRHAPEGRTAADHRCTRGSFHGDAPARSSSCSCAINPCTSSTCGTRATCCDVMRDDHLGVSGGSTYFLTSLLDHPDFSDEHLALMPWAGLGGSPIPVAVAERATALGIKLFRSYGSTEHPSITGSYIDEPRGQATDHRRTPSAERRAPARRRRADPHRGADCFVGYTDPDADRRGVRRRRLVPHRRHRSRRRRRLPDDHRSHLRHHHPRRREHQRPGGRGGPAWASTRSPR